MIFGIDIKGLRRLPGAVLSWWFGELAGLLPQRLRRFLSDGNEALFFEFSGSEIVVLRRLNGRTEQLARLNAGDDAGEQRAEIRRVAGDRTMRRAEIVLSLSAEQVLRKTLDLPLASESSLEELLFFELDRQTPFKPDQVQYDFTVVERDRAEQRLRVELVVATRDIVDKVVEQASAWGLVPAAVTVSSADGVAEQRINLLSRDGRAVTSRGGRSLVSALVLLLVVLSAVAVYLPLKEQGRAAAAAEIVLADIRVAAEEAVRLRDELDRIVKASGFLAERKQSAPKVTAILADLTRALPDDTWLFELQIKGGEMRARGYSPAASSILEIVERSPVFQDVRFTSPVTRVPGIDKERFDLTFSLSKEEAG